MTNTSFNGVQGQEQFLQLLVTQLQYQDPLSPMEQTDFLSQLAQFSSLEAMQQLNVRFADMLALQELTEGASLLGRTVIFRNPETGASDAGIVQAAHVDGDRLMLVIGGYEVSLDEVQTIVADPTA